jgi:N-acetylneuraminic acid mutarotase
LLKHTNKNNDSFLSLPFLQWQEIKPKPGASWPSARSAFQFASLLDEVFLYGGYFKDAMADKDGSEKGVVHADMWTLDPRTWEWNKVKKLGMPPGPRAGFSMCVHKKRAILFGGVVDTEVRGKPNHSSLSSARIRSQILVREKKNLNL